MTCRSDPASSTQHLKKKKATVPGRRRGLPPILQDPREEEGAFATVEGPVDPLFSEPRAREEEGPMVPTCALREEEESDVS
jgi:hypothetical protein